MLDSDETKKLGAEMFFNKPYSMHDLEQILSFVLSEKWKRVNLFLSLLFYLLI